MEKHTPIFPALKRQITFGPEGYRLIRAVDLLLDDDVPPGNLREGTPGQTLSPGPETRVFNARGMGPISQSVPLPSWLLRLFFDSAISGHNRTG
jgi:hypothetical protein